MKILLFGKDGQVGRELQRSLAPLGRVVSLARHHVDLRSEDAIRATIRSEKPHFIVNAAAYTDVDAAEHERTIANAVNSTAVGIMAEEATVLGAWLIHYSTDYVFDGKMSGPHVETDCANPLNYYGLSKLNGEVAVRESGCPHLILRSSWIYSEHSANFPLAILDRAQRADHLRVVCDSVGSPTSAHLVADTTALLMYRIHECRLGRDNFSGTFHLSASGSTSWYEYARFLVKAAADRGWRLRVDRDSIYPVRQEEYGSAAARPHNSVLNTHKLQTTFGLELPPWQYHVELLLDKLEHARFPFTH